MAKGDGKVLNFVAWLTGVIVSLAVGLALIPNGALSGSGWLPVWLTTIAGWIVVITTIISAVMAILKQ